MSTPPILVIGATGKTGTAVVEQCLRRGWTVRALAHRLDARTDRLARAGAEVVVGDLFDHERVRSAMDGIGRAYIAIPFHPHMLQASMVAAIAARDARLESLVILSQWLASPRHPSAATRQSWIADQAVAATAGIPCTILNPGMFADNFLRIIEFPALLGVYPVMTGDARCAPVASEDIARVACAILADPAPHAGRTYRPTGPALLTGAEMAAIIGQVLARRVRPVPLPFSLFVKAARGQGVDPFELSGYRHYLEDLRRGAFAAGDGVTDAVAAITGHPAEPFAATVGRYACRPSAQPTLANRIRAWSGFLATPLRRGWDLDRYDRTLRLPTISDPHFAVESPVWRRTHLPVGSGAGVVVPG